MSYAMRHAVSVVFFVCSLLILMGPAFSQDDNAATEPSVRGAGVIDFDVSVKVIAQDAIHPWSQAGLFIMNDLSDRTQGGYAFLTATPTRVAYFWDEQEPIGELEHNTQVMTKEKPIWLRLVKKGRLLSSYFRVNEDDAWTPVVIDNATLDLADNVYVGLYSFSHSSAQTGTVHMDDFLCTQ